MVLPSDMICPYCLNEIEQRHIRGNEYEYKCNCGYVLDVDEEELYKSWAKEI
jgi:hypothetical protein